LGEPVEQRGRHLRVAEHARPFGEGQVGRDDDRGALVKSTDQVEEQLAAGVGEGQIAEFVEHDEVEPGKVIGEPALPTTAGLGLLAVDEVDGGAKTAPCAIADAGTRDGDGEVALAGAVVRTLQLAPHALQAGWQWPVLERGSIPESAGFAGEHRHVMPGIVDRLATAKATRMLADNRTILADHNAIGPPTKEAYHPSLT